MSHRCIHRCIPVIMIVSACVFRILGRSQAPVRGRRSPSRGSSTRTGKCGTCRASRGLMRQRLSSVRYAQAPSARLFSTSPFRSGATSVSFAMKSLSPMPRNAAILEISASDTRTMPSSIRQHAPQHLHLKSASMALRPCRPALRLRICLVWDNMPHIADRLTIFYTMCPMWSIVAWCPAG